MPLYRVDYGTGLCSPFLMKDFVSILAIYMDYMQSRWSSKLIRYRSLKLPTRAISAALLSTSEVAELLSVLGTTRGP